MNETSDTNKLPSVGGSGATTGSARPAIVDDLARAAVRLLSGSITTGTIVLDGPGAGGRWRIGHGDPVVEVAVHDRRAFGSLLLHGSVGLGDSYGEGWWDCSDLTGLIEVIVSNRSTLGRARDRVGSAMSRVVDPVRRHASPTKEDAKRDISTHYDLSNDFFALMLDPTMSYSCGLFAEPGSTLEEASKTKLDRICAKLALGASDHVVEIGTGWGGFAIHAASTYGCRVTTTTISDQQYDYACKGVAEAGVADLVTVLKEDYRDLHGSYDKLVSIEMIEAVDWRLHDNFFATCSGLLEPGGLMALQAITVADQSYDRAKNSQDFIKTFIFPGSCLPSVSAIAGSVARATDMRIIDLEDIGRHYAPTLRHWADNLDARAEAVAGLGMGERFSRLWKLYLCYCEAAFLAGHISDVQVVLAKPAWRPPLTLRK